MLCPKFLRSPLSFFRSTHRDATRKTLSSSTLRTARRKALSEQKNNEQFVSRICIRGRRGVCCGRARGKEVDVRVNSKAGIFVRWWNGGRVLRGRGGGAWPGRGADRANGCQRADTAIRHGGFGGQAAHVRPILQECSSAQGIPVDQFLGTMGFIAASLSVTARSAIRQQAEAWSGITPRTIRKSRKRAR